MKIALTIHHFPPNFSAGAEIYAFRLAHWLLKHGYEVEVVCIESISHGISGEIEHKHELYEGISVWRLYFNADQSPDPFRQSFDNPAIGTWFAQFLTQTQPDMVHINSCYLLSVNTISVAKQLGFPVIVTLHDFWFLCPRITLLKPTGEICTVPENVAECAWCLATEQRRFRWPEEFSRGAVGVMVQHLLGLPFGDRLLGIYPDVDVLAERRELLLKKLNQADVILSPSEFLRSLYIKQGVAPDKILYSRVGLETNHWLPLSNSSKKGESPELRISYIGQVSPHKGVHLLLQAFNRLDFSQRSGQLKIYGGLTAFPEYVEELKRIANGNPAIEFVGRFDNSRVAEIMSETDVTVVPSVWYENSPIAIMEALTTGTPVVATNLGGMAELVQHEVNGLLFKVGDVNDLTRQLQRLLDEADLVPTLARRAQPVRLIEDEMSQLISLYEQVITQTRFSPEAV